MTRIALDRSRLRNPESLRTLEWLVTNGRGGFAMGTAANLLARRYHGLLVAAITPPLDRWLLLAKLEPTAVVDGQRYELATNDYPSVVHPSGYQYLDSFTTEPLPIWRYRIPGVALIEQTLAMPPGADSVYVQFRLLEGRADLHLEVRPLCTSRSMFDLLERPDLGEPRLDARRGGFTLSWSDRPRLHLDTNGSFAPLPDWYYQFVLTTETSRGQSDRQDLFMPGPIRATLRQGDATGLVIAAGSAPVRWQEWESARDVASAHRMAAPLPADIDDPLAIALARATDQFVVDRGEKKTVIAGYPWFGDWGRDTFISLPGLCLVTGRLEMARQIIDTFADHVDGGLIPNRFPDSGEKPEYNTVDASLWFIHAIDRYLAYSGDWAFVESRLFDVISHILDAHEAGTRHRIKADRDGLLAAGEPGVQLTWMDAKFGDWVVTPRIGKPVEINALWYNALRIASAFAARVGKRAKADHWAGLADQAAKSFNFRFWNALADCCYDVVDCDHVPGRCDASIRPNQLFAISLTYPVLDRARFAPVVRVCRERLLTPLGMRTLDPAHPEYQPHYTGDMRRRDGAYHRGTVWPWLIGAFVTAQIRAEGDTPAARKAARSLLAGIEAHLLNAGLGSVSEIAEAAEPHRPDGCPWQAWSVAEPLRALVEDVYGYAPADRVTSPKARSKTGAASAGAAG